MTKEITKARIIQEIENKFGLRELEPERFSFSEMVIPIYNIQQHIQKWGSLQLTKSITASGPIAIKTIPDAEKWTLRAYTVTFMTGVYTLAGVYILRKLCTAATDFSYLDLTAAQTVSYLRTLPEPVVLEPGDRLLFNIDGFTSTGNLRIDMDLMREEVR